MGKSANVLVHAGLGASQEPEDTLDNKVGDEPSEAASGDGSVDIGRFEEVGNESIDG